MIVYRKTLLSAASVAAMATGPSVAWSAQCTPVTRMAGFDLLLEVEGASGQFRLTCEAGRLLAVPLAGQQAEEPDGSPPAPESEAAVGGVPEALSAVDVPAAPDDAGTINASAAKAAESMAAEDGADLRAPPPALLSEDIDAPATAGAASPPAADASDAADKSAIDPVQGPGEDAASTEPGLPGAADATEPPAEAATSAAAEAADATPGSDAGAVTEPGVNAAGVGGLSPTAVSPPDDGEEEAGSDSQTGRNAAGVTGQSPDASVAEEGGEVSPPDEAASAMGGSADSRSDKPAVAAEDAGNNSGRPGSAGAKDEARISADDERSMVRVPLIVLANARMAVPGVTFKSVAVSGERNSMVYGLSGEAASGRDVSVDVEPSGKILRIEQQVTMREVPDAIMRIASALVPQARLDKVMRSNRENYQTYFVFAGLDPAGAPFELEIRADGRSVNFLRNG